jgi:hypothetical protein
MPYETWIESLVRTKRCRTYGAVVTYPTLFLIDHKSFAVTENLYFSLLRLRDHRIPRIFWIHDVCIDQTDDLERESQIQFMADIYADASRVVVWPGRTQQDSTQAFDSTFCRREVYTGSFQKPIQKLLRRQWFRRIG